MPRRTPRDRALLHRTAAELQPKVAPFYVAAPTRPGMLSGWYWVPADGDPQHPEPLGANVYFAEVTLLMILTP